MHLIAALRNYQFKQRLKVLSAVLLHTNRPVDALPRASARDCGERELVLGVSPAWPAGARAQQGERMRRIGVLMASAADEPVSQGRLAAFLQGLSQLGWTDDRNVRIETRWATTNADDLRRHAAELVALSPDIILASSSVGTGPLLQVTRSLPIVFVHTPIRSVPGL
jgi:hypothetical protein